MSVSLSAKRSWAFLASAAVGLGSIASTPVAFADTTTTSVASQTQVHNTADSFTQAETTWGLRDSFRDYLLRGVAQGTQKLARVGTNPKGEYTFGEFDASKSRVTDDGYEIVYTGSKIHYTGHHGVLETIITDFSIIISKDGKGEVRANVQSRPYEGTTPQPLKSYQNIKLGTFDASDLKHDGNNISLAASDKTKVILAEEATPVFAGFYDAGQKLDAISFSGRIARGSAETPAQPSPSEKPTTPAPAPKTNTVQPEAPKTDQQPAADASKAEEKPAAPAPTAPAAPALPNNSTNTAKGHVVESGSMQWGIRDSFLRYLSTLARGSIQVSGMEKTNAGGLNWTKASGAFDPATQTGQISFAGEVHITGHHGQLNSTFSNTRLVAVNGKGYLVVDAEALNLKGEHNTFKDLIMAEVDLSGASYENNVFKLSNAAVTVTVAGSNALFAGQYSDADKRAMAPLNLSVKLGEQLTDLNVSQPDIAKANQGGGNTPQLPGAGDNSDSTASGGSGVSSSDSSNSGDASSSSTLSSGGSGSGTTVSTNPAQPVCVPVTRTRKVAVAPTTAAKDVASASDGKVVTAELGWGVKDSFRSYVRGGIANGNWDLSGTTFAHNTFNWSSGSGTVKDGKGSVSFTGSIHFTGHHGILDSTIANPRLDINGSKGVLYATLTSNNMEGKSNSYGEVALLDVDLSGLQTSNGSVSVKGASTKLTEAGAKSFAGFYSAGQDMSPLSFNASLSKSGESSTPAAAQPTEKTITETVYEGEGCDKKPLAHTGASGVQSSVAGGVSALLTGVGALFYVRRSRAQTSDN